MAIAAYFSYLLSIAAITKLCLQDRKECGLSSSRKHGLENPCSFIPKIKEEPKTNSFIWHRYRRDGVCLYLVTGGRVCAKW